MSTKTLLISSVLSGILLFMAAGVCFGDTSELLVQAETYREQGQYEQAEAIYLQIVTELPGTDYAFQAQKKLTLIYISTDRQQQADASSGQLFTDFYEHPGISQAVWQIAKGYEQTKKYDKALELHQYNVQQFRPDRYAMWSQTEIIYLNINRGENAAADTAFERLIALFSSQTTLPKEIYQIAMKYNSLERYEKGLELYQYNVGHCSKDNIYTMWSQVEIVKSHIHNDNAAADAGCETLLSVFSEQPTLSKEVYQIADLYSKAGKNTKAGRLYQHVVDKWPKSEQAVPAQMNLAIYYVDQGDDLNAQAATDKLITSFSENSQITKSIHEVAQHYRLSGKHEKAKQLYQYNVDNFSGDMYTMWSQVEIVKYHISDANDAAAETACDTLLTKFSGQPTLPKEVYQIAMKHSDTERPDKAFQLHQYNVEHSSKDDMYTMWSKVEIVKSYIRDANDAAADEAFDKLLAEFSGQPTLPKEIYQIVDEYAMAGKYDKADQIYQHVLDNWPEAEQDGLEHIGVAEINVLSLIESGNDTAAKEALDSLIGDFNEHPNLAWTLDGIAGRYEKFLKHNEARSIYRKIATDFNETDYALTAQKKLAILEIKAGDEVAAQAALDILIADFNEYHDSPEAVFVVGEQYYNWAFQCEKAKLSAKATDKFQKAIAVWQRIITDLSSSSITPQAYYMSARCYERIGKYENAIDYYSIVVDNWPDYEFAWNAQFLIGRCFDKLARAGTISKVDAAPLIREACEKLITNYPDSMAVNAAINLLKRWESVNSK
jgi:tetratricopeptide (TPR) repeat protein